MTEVSNLEWPERVDDQDDPDHVALADETEAAEPSPARDVIELGSGEAMDARQTVAVTGSRRSVVIVLAGPQESGKTTLAATIYEQFHRGPFSGLLFAGSETLVGWERRCHLARLESGGTVPDTERTSRGEPMRFLHLALRGAEPSGQKTDILLGDVTGETYTRAMDHEEEARSLVLLRRADWTVVLVDGQRLCGPDRHVVVEQTATLLRSCLEAEVLESRSRVSVAFSKWDLVTQHPAHEVGEATADHAESELRRRFQGLLGELRFVRTSARGRALQGLETLLHAWVERPIEGAVVSAPVELNDVSQYLNYAWKASLPGTSPGTRG